MELTQKLKETLLNQGRRELIDSKYAITKVGYQGWNYISKNMGPEVDLWRYLYDYGRNKAQTLASESVSSDSFCGEEIYLSIRPKLIAKKLIYGNEPVATQKPTKPNSKTNKQTNKRGAKNTVEKIRQQNIVARLGKDFDNLMEALENDNSDINKDVVYTAKFVELVFVKLMNHCKILTSKYTLAEKELESLRKSKFSSKLDIEETQSDLHVIEKKINEMIIGFNKIINEKSSNQKISETCVSDLNKWILYAKTLVKFDAANVIINMPELVFKTAYDGILGERRLSIYKSQADIFEFMTTTESCLALAHTMTNSGKTTLITALCGWMHKHRKSPNQKVIYCCPNRVMLLEVARMVYGISLPFAIVVYAPDVKVTEYDDNGNKIEKTVKDPTAIDYKFSSFCDPKNLQDSCVLYICDMCVGRLILEKKEQRYNEYLKYMHWHSRDPRQFPLTPDRVPTYPDYMFIGDELTIDADSVNGFMVDSGFSVTTEIFISIMKLLPNKVLFASATLPTEEQLQHEYNEIVKCHPGMVIKSFTSSESKIGCALVSSSGKLFAPHSGCQTVAELRQTLVTIQTNPFVGRFYTFELLIKMVEINKRFGLKVPDLSDMYNDPSKAKQSNIQANAYEIINTLIDTNNDQLVSDVCNFVIDGKVGVNLATMLTSDFSRFNKGCLVFSSNPLETAIKVYRANFDNFLPQKTSKNIFKQVRIDDYIEEHRKEIEVWEKTVERIQNKTDLGANKINKKAGKKERSKTETWQKMSSIIDQRPTWKFPKALQLCSIEHLNLSGCAPDNISVGGLVGPDDLPSESSVSADILTMLASGIGVYSNKLAELDEDYLKTVIFLAKNDMIKVIFTDSSIAYGTNLAISDIIVIDEPVQLRNGTVKPSVVDEHSMKTIFQMLSRAGRSGNLSYEARIYTTSESDCLINNIRKFTRNSLDEGTKDEISNIRRAFRALW